MLATSATPPRLARPLSAPLWCFRLPATATVTDSLALAEADEADTEEDAVADEAEVDDADADTDDADAETEVEDAEDEEEELVASALRRLCCGSSSVSSGSGCSVSGFAFTGALLCAG